MITIYVAHEIPDSLRALAAQNGALDMDQQLQWCIVHPWPTPREWKQDIMADGIEGILMGCQTKADAYSWSTKADTGMLKVRFVVYE